MFKTSTFLVFIFLTLSLKLSAAPVINCSGFWEYFGKTFKCQEYFPTGAPMMINGQSYRFFHYDEGWEESAEKLAILNLTKDALIDAQKVFVKYGQVPSIYFILMNIDHPGDTGKFQAYAEANPNIIKGPEPCPVSIYKATMGANADQVKQIIAHEIFHCFQGQNMKLQLKGPTGPSDEWGKITGWWVEGTANYFSNLVYPAVNFEHKSMYTYKAGVQPQTQENSYSVAALFQSLGNSEWFGTEKIIDLLKKMPLNGDHKNQRKSLSKMTVLRFPFHHFARQLVDQKIVDSGGGYLPTQYLPGEMISFEVVKENKTYESTVLPFSAQIVEFNLPAGGEFTFHNLMPLFQERGIIAGIRKKGETQWGELHLLDRTYNTSCANSAVTIEVLITSIEDSDEKLAAPIAIDFAKLDCPCKKTNTPLPACYVGNFQLDNSIIFKVFEDMGQSDLIKEVTGNVNVTVKPTHEAQLDFLDWAIKSETTIPMNDTIVKIKNLFTGSVQGELGESASGDLCFMATQDDSYVTTTVTFPKGEEVTDKVANSFASSEASSNALTTSCSAAGIKYTTNMGGTAQGPIEGFLKRLP
jgi:hypothetical protein